MQITQLSMKPLADHLAIAHDDCPNKRIRANSTTPALRKLKRSLEVLPIRSCKRRGHID
jgi:hypothetical protein